MTVCRNCGQPYNELANGNACGGACGCQGCERTGDPAWLIPERARQALPAHQVIEEGIADDWLVDEFGVWKPFQHPYVAVRYADGTEDVLEIDWEYWDWDDQPRCMRAGPW